MSEYKNSSLRNCA